MLKRLLVEKTAVRVDSLSEFCQSATAFLQARLRLLAMLLCAALLAGCAGLGQSGSAEDRLSERAHARWQALIKADFDQAYEFETPGYRAVFSKQAFQNRFGRHVRWQDAEVRAVTLDGDTAEVRVLISYQALTPEGQLIDGSQPIWERWQLVDGEWWYTNR